MTPRIDRSAYGVVIGFGGAGLCVLIVGLAQLFGKFRHVMPDVREWLLVNGDAVREVVLRWVA